MNVASCPNCSNSTATPVRFIWWGGFLGPKLFNVVKCSSCNKQYNGKTGRPNTNAIIIYLAVSIIIIVAFFAILPSI